MNSVLLSTVRVQSGHQLLGRLNVPRRDDTLRIRDPSVRDVPLIVPYINASYYT